jgi:hypothetical protein
MERILARSLGDVFVGTDTGSLESLARELFILVRNEMAAEGKVIDGCTFAAQVEDTDLLQIVEIATKQHGRYKRTFGSGTPRL